MPRYTKEKQTYHLALIRRFLVQNPNITALEIVDKLDSGGKPIKLHREYVGKLMKKVHKEQYHKVDNYVLNKFLAKYTERIEELDRYLWAVLNSDITTASEKVAAIRELRNNANDVYERLANAGIFTKQLGEVTLKNVNILKLETADLLKLLERMEVEQINLLPNGTDTGNQKQDIDSEPQ